MKGGDGLEGASAGHQPTYCSPAAAAASTAVRCEYLEMTMRRWHISGATRRHIDRVLVH